MASGSKFLEIPPWGELEKYYREITGPHPGVRVAMTSSMGKGLFASEAFEPGDVVLREAMLVGMQHTANKAHALVCAFCLRFVGSIELQVARQLPLGQLMPGADGGEEATESSDSDGNDGEDEGEEHDGGEEEGEEDEDEEECDANVARSEGQGHESGAEASYGASSPVPREAPPCASAGPAADHKRPREFLESGKSPASHADEAAPNGISPLVREFLEGARHLPWTHKFALPQPVDCRGGCDAQVFCSTECMEAAWESFHCLLCTGPNSRAQSIEAIRDFAHHADETNDIFHLAATVLAKTMLGARKLSQQEGEADGKPRADGQIASPLMRAWLPFAAGHKARWWDALARPQDVPADEERCFRESIRATAETSLALLKEAICSPQFANLFTLDLYGSIIGMFELNNLEVVVVSPLAQYREHLKGAAAEEPSVSEEHRDAEESRRREPAEGLALLDELAAVLDASWVEPCRGTAFYALQSCVNHSCKPNASATKDAKDLNGDAVIVAKTKIQQGDEITLSYIDEGTDYNVRQESLRDYGFLCRCELCASQEQAK